MDHTSIEPQKTPATPGPSPSAHSPRVWTALAAFPICFIAYMLVQILVMLVLAAVTFPADSGEPFLDHMNAPSVLLPAIILGQFSLLIMPLIAAKLSPQFVNDRLALHRPRVPWWGLIVIGVGTLFVATISIQILSLIGAQPSAHMLWMSETFSSFTGLAAVGLLLAVGIMPGLGEEFLFRGYIQTRLVARMGPLLAILIASAMFALMHIDPQHMLVALMLGIWCGIAAWRTASLWTAVFCHGLNNTVAISMALLAASTEVDDTESGTLDNFWAVPVPYMIFTGVLFIAAVAVLIFVVRPASPRR